MVWLFGWDKKLKRDFEFEYSKGRADMFRSAFFITCRQSVYAGVILLQFIMFGKQKCYSIYSAGKLQRF